MRYAIRDNVSGEVLNLIVYDGQSTFTPAEGTSVIGLEDETIQITDIIDENGAIITRVGSAPVVIESPRNPE